MMMTMQDKTQEILALSRAGVVPSVIYEALWPGVKPFDLATLSTIIRQLEVADATEIPTEELPSDLEDAYTSLIEARVRIVETIRAGGDTDENGRFDARPHKELINNAEALLKFQSARQSRVEHRLALRCAQEKARIELARLYEGEEEAQPRN